MRLGVLLAFALAPFAAFASNQNFDVKIDGMSCGPCVKAVTQALEKIENVDKGSIKVSLKEKSAKLSVANTKPETVEAIKKAVEKAGFTVTSVDTGAAPAPKKN